MSQCVCVESFGEVILGFVHVSINTQKSRSSRTRPACITCAKRLHQAINSSGEKDGTSSEQHSPSTFGLV